MEQQKKHQQSLKEYEEAFGKTSEDFNSQDPNRNLHLAYVNEGCDGESKKKRMKKCDTETVKSESETTTISKNETEADKKQMKTESNTEVNKQSLAHLPAQ